MDQLRFLWVDALCINQEDNDEKSVQISMMGKIYENCRCSLMWLGEEEAASDLALELIGHFEEAVGDDFDLKRNPRFRELIFGDQFSRHWEAIGELFKRPYWQRLWNLQETVLPRSQYLCCGSAMASWEGFQCFLTIISTGQFFSGFPRELVFCASSRVAQSTALRLKIIASKPVSFLEGLLVSRNLDAAEPKDKIYGILSSVCHEGFDPCYGQPTVSLYRDVVKFIVGQDQDLDILAACHHSHNEARLNETEFVRLLMQGCISSAQAINISLADPNFSAEGTSALVLN